MSRQITRLRNLYARLGISRTSTQSEIKSAYYKLSKECHPDRNSGCARATQQFREITEAYDVLRNEKSRKEYDICAPNDGRVATTPRWTGSARSSHEYASSSYEYSKRDQDFEEMIRSYRRARRTNWPRADTAYSNRSRVYDFDTWFNSHYGDFRRSGHAWNPSRQARTSQTDRKTNSDAGESSGSDEPREENSDRPLHKYSKEFEFKHVYVHPMERAKARLRNKKRNEIIAKFASYSVLFVFITVCAFRI